MSRPEYTLPQESRSRSGSILSRDFVRAILLGADENLQRDGSLQPVLFLRLKNGKRGIVPLELPETHAEKEMYFAGLGLFVARTSGPLDEAVFVSESWYVSPEQGTDFSRIRPSRHPLRQEAILISGRNAAETREAFVIQTFGRDAQNRPVPGAVMVEEYHDTTDDEPGLHAVSLLDYLFPPRERA